MSKRNSAQIVVDAMEAAGVETVFGVPGEETLELLEALDRSSIRFVVTRHEQAAGFMAATMGRLTGRPGACLTTLGPGACNAVTAAAFAHLGAMPVLFVSGQKPLHVREQGLFQLLDVVELMTPVTKDTRTLVSARRAQFEVRDALRRTQLGRRGPVHLELPMDVAEDEDAGGVAFPRDEPTAPRSAPSRRDLEAALEEIEQAQRPLLLVGAGANQHGCFEALRELVDRWQIPFVTTQMGKGAVSDRHDACVGTCAVSAGDFPHRAIAEADLIVMLGHDVVEKPPFVMSADGPRVLHVAQEPAQLDAVYFPQRELVGSLPETATALLELRSSPLEMDREPFRLLVKVNRDSMNGDGPDWDPRRTVHEIRDFLPDNGIVSLDNGLYKIWFAREYPALQPNTLLLDNALATMGAGLPAGMAAALVHPNRPVVAVCGDGGFLMNSAELETAVRLELDLTILVLRDDALGMIGWKQESEGRERIGVSFGNPDFVALAEAYGARGRRVERPDDLPDALRSAGSRRGVHLLEVPVDYSRSESLLGDELPRRSAELSLTGSGD